MKLYRDMTELLMALRGIVSLEGDKGLGIKDQGGLRDSLIDELVYNAIFNGSQQIREVSGSLIQFMAFRLGILPASIRDLYRAMGNGEVKGFTVPAFNLRGLTYDMARAAICAALQHRVGPFIFEIARSEISYTQQRPLEYALAIMAAAIKEGYQGPLFLQGDHFQINPKRYTQDAQGEVGAIKDLVREAIEAHFYNIDIDASTLVDLSQHSILEQQRKNFELTAELTDFIRGLEPEGVAVSIGGEIGEVGGKNSTVEELRVFMDNYLEVLSHKQDPQKGISKISVQTGTTHGGIPLPDGTVATVKLDFSTLESLSQVARQEYKLAGAVQHGASTLPEEFFDKFPQVGCAEIHLATGFQNLVFDSEVFPPDLKQEIYDYLRNNFAQERKPQDTEEQFLYKTRKKAFGPFKKELWDLPAEVRESLRRELTKRFALLYNKLQVVNSSNLLRGLIIPPPPPQDLPAELIRALSSGLA